LLLSGPLTTAFKAAALALSLTAAAGMFVHQGQCGASVSRWEVRAVPATRLAEVRTA
jgi:hypothetical protein